VADLNTSTLICDRDGVGEQRLLLPLSLIILAAILAVMLGSRH
jgi:hypothetical protein